MSTITTTIENNGNTYAGQIGTIKSTSFGTESHGIITATLHVQWKGGGIGVGGYCLDEPKKDAEGKHLGRFGTSYGLDHLMRVMETVGVDTWEQLPGKQVIVLFADGGGWGSTACGLAGITNEKVLDFKEHASSFRETSEVSA